MIMKLFLIIKVIILEKEKEQIKLGKWANSLRKCHINIEYGWHFSIVKIRLRHVHILNVNYSGALARKARQRSTMGKTMR